MFAVCPVGHVSIRDVQVAGLLGGVTVGFSHGVPMVLNT